MHNAHGLIKQTLEHIPKWEFSIYTHTHAFNQISNVDEYMACSESTFALLWFQELIVSHIHNPIQIFLSSSVVPEETEITLERAAHIILGLLHLLDLLSAMYMHCVLKLMCRDE